MCRSPHRPIHSMGVRFRVLLFFFSCCACLLSRASLSSFGPGEHHLLKNHPSVPQSTPSSSPFVSVVVTQESPSTNDTPLGGGTRPRFLSDGPSVSDSRPASMSNVFMATGGRERAATLGVCSFPSPPTLSLR